MFVIGCAGGLNVAESLMNATKVAEQPHLDDVERRSWLRRKISSRRSSFSFRK